MSSTNRGRKRIVLDNYPTPEKVTRLFLENFNMDLNKLNVFEPCSGSGGMCKVIREMYPECKIWANEIRGEERTNLQSYANHITLYDVLEIDKINLVDVILTNPPYNKAQEILNHIFKIKDSKTIVIMLLRTAFLESKKRYDFWQKYPLNGLYTLSQRPSFTGSGTDSTSYSFFIWDGTDKQVIKVI